MTRYFRVAVLAILLVSAKLPGNQNQIARGQFGTGPSEEASNPQQLKNAPAVAEKPSPCDLVPDGAVTKGSFTAWTEPQNPKPGQQYVIVVQIKGLKNVERFPRCDLSGSVTGTDGYKDHFGGPTEHGFLAVKDQTVRLPLLVVPGAAELVKDTIQIKSQLLSEEQLLEIKFLKPTSKAPPAQ